MSHRLDAGEAIIKPEQPWWQRKSSPARDSDKHEWLEASRRDSESSIASSTASDESDEVDPQRDLFAEIEADLAREKAEEAARKKLEEEEAREFGIALFKKWEADSTTDRSRFLLLRKLEGERVVREAQKSADQATAEEERRRLASTFGLF